MGPAFAGMVFGRPATRAHEKRPTFPSGVFVLGLWSRLAYSFVATVLNVELRLVPTVPITVTAATAIRAAIRPYSIAVTPSSLLNSLFNVANIRVSLPGRRPKFARQCLMNR